MRYIQKLAKLFISLFVVFTMSYMGSYATQVASKGAPASKGAVVPQAPSAHSIGKKDLKKIEKALFEIVEKAEEKKPSSNPEENKAIFKRISEIARKTQKLQYKEFREGETVGKKTTIAERDRKKGEKGDIDITDLAENLTEGLSFEQTLYDIWTGKLKKARTKKLDNPKINSLEEIRVEVEQGKFNPSGTKNGLLYGKIEKLYYLIMITEPDINEPGISGNVEFHQMGKFLKVVVDVVGKEIKDGMDLGKRMLKLKVTRIKPEEVKRLSKKYLELLYVIQKRLKTQTKAYQEWFSEGRYQKAKKSLKKAKKRKLKFEEEFARYGIDHTAATMAEGLRNAFHMDVELYFIKKISYKDKVRELEEKIAAEEALIIKMKNKADLIAKLDSSDVKKYLELVEKTNSELISHTKFKLLRKTRIKDPNKLRELSRKYLSLLWEFHDQNTLDQFLLQRKASALQKLFKTKRADIEKSVKKLKELVDRTLVSTAAKATNQETLNRKTNIKLVPAGKKSVLDGNRGIHMAVALYASKRVDEDDFFKEWLKNNPLSANELKIKKLNRYTLKLQARIIYLSRIFVKPGLIFKTNRRIQLLDGIKESFVKVDFLTFLKEVKDVHKTIKSRCKTGLKKAVTLTVKEFGNPQKARDVATNYFNLLFYAKGLIEAFHPAIKKKMGSTAKYVLERSKRVGVYHAKTEADALLSSMFMDVELYAAKKIANFSKKRLVEFMKTYELIDAEFRKLAATKSVKGRKLKLQIKELIGVCNRIPNTIGGRYIAQLIKEIRNIKSLIKEKMKTSAISKLKQALVKKLSIPDAQEIGQLYMRLLWTAGRRMGPGTSKLVNLKGYIRTANNFAKFVKEFAIKAEATSAQAGTANAMYMRIELYVIDGAKDLPPKLRSKQKDEILIRQIQRMETLLAKMNKSLGPSEVLKYLKRVKEINSDIVSHTKFKVGRVGRIEPNKLRKVARTFFGLLWETDKKTKANQLDLKNSKKTSAFLTQTSQDMGVSSSKPKGLVRGRGIHIKVELYAVNKMKQVTEKMSVLEKILSYIETSYLKKYKNTFRRAITGLAGKTKLGAKSKTLKELLASPALRTRYLALLKKTRNHKSGFYTKYSFYTQIMRFYDDDLDKYDDAHNDYRYAEYMLKNLVSVRSEVIGKKLQLNKNIADLTARKKSARTSRNKLQKYDAWLNNRYQSYVNQYEADKQKALAGKKGIKKNLGISVWTRSPISEGTANLPKVVIDRINKRDAKGITRKNKIKANLKLKSIRPDKKVFGIF